MNNYYFAEASQNTFLLFDCLDDKELTQDFIKKAHALLMKEDRDDALILINKKIHGAEFYFEMLVLGQDGTFGEFCGNGTRACAAFIYNQYPWITKLFLKNQFGIHPLRKLKKDHYSITLFPVSFKINPKFVTSISVIEKYHLVYAEMIEPHLLIQENLSDEELFRLGKILNASKEIFPLGINVNAWSLQKDGSLFVKTYERGVQRLTKSCGSGSICCASYFNPQGSISVTTLGGCLKIDFQDKQPTLIGSAILHHPF